MLMKYVKKYVTIYSSTVEARHVEYLLPCWWM